MVITRIEETNQTLISPEISSRKTGRRACIYYPEVSCAVPNLKLQVCRSCPRAAAYVRTNAVQAVFLHVRAIAIALMKSFLNK